MSEKMLVTQALDERDLLVKKITDKIAKAKAGSLTVAISALSVTQAFDMVLYTLPQ